MVADAIEQRLGYLDIAEGGCKKSCNGMDASYPIRHPRAATVVKNSFKSKPSFAQHDVKFSFKEKSKIFKADIQTQLFLKAPPSV